MTAPDAGQPGAEAVEAVYRHPLIWRLKKREVLTLLALAYPAIRRQVIEERDELLLEVARSGVEGGNDGP